VVGLGSAARLAQESLESGEEQRIAGMRNRLLEALLQLDGVAVNGSMQRRIARNVNVRVDGIDSSALLKLAPGLAFSTSSACASVKSTPSHVLAAIGLSVREAQSSFRVGLGRGTTIEQVDQAAAQLVAAIRVLRSLSLGREAEQSCDMAPAEGQ
jgi:cysteine desulfurase